MKRLPMFLIILAGFILLSILEPNGAGFAAHCHNFDCHSAARASLTGILYGLTFGLVVLLLPQKKTRLISGTSVSFWQSLGALALNSVIIMIALINLLTLPILLIEAQYTGEFHWAFTRDFTRATDWLFGVPELFLILGLIFYYYVWSLLKGRPTIGQYVLGYRVVKHGEPWTRKSAFRYVRQALLDRSNWPKAFNWLNAQKTDFKIGKKVFHFNPPTDGVAQRFDYAN